MLELNVLESGIAELLLRPENLGEMVHQAISRHQDSAELKQIGLRFDIDPDLPEEITCDRAKLLRVLDSLLSNAFRFTDAGEVQLKITRVHDGLLFQVTDSGTGVPPELQQQIFNKFSQADDSPTRAKDGAGLGLSIAAQIVAQMGGQITLQSLKGKGSTFSFLLPIEPRLTVPH
ncbi:MAG: ATP-binding protein [Oxalobacteraceae bacterium]